MKKLFCFLFFTITFLGSCNTNTDSENKNESDSTISPGQDNKKELDTIPRAAAVKMIKHFRDTAIVSHKFSSLIHLVRFNTEDLKKFSESADSVKLFMAADTNTHEHTIIIQRKWDKGDGKKTSLFYNIMTYKQKAMTDPDPRCPQPPDCSEEIDN